MVPAFGMAIGQSHKRSTWRTLRASAAMLICTSGEMERFTRPSSFHLTAWVKWNYKHHVMKAKSKSKTPRSKRTTNANRKTNALLILHGISKAAPPTAEDMRSRQCTLYTLARYREALHMALYMKPALEGDHAYFEPVINYVALQERITGWIMAQPYYLQFARELEKHFQRDTPELHVTDMAAQIVSDITRGNDKFAAE